MPKQGGEELGQKEKMIAVLYSLSFIIAFSVTCKKSRLHIFSEVCFFSKKKQTKKCIDCDL